MCYLRRLAGIIAVSCLLFSCAASEKDVTERLCPLCDYQGLQGNGRLGVLIADSGQIMEIRIPPYEAPDGRNGDEKAGGFSMSTGKDVQGINRVTVTAHPGEGTARVSADIKRKAKPDMDALKKLYCQDCVQKIKKTRTGILLVDLRDRSVYQVGGERTFWIREYEVISQNDDNRGVMEIRYEAQ